MSHSGNSMTSRYETAGRRRPPGEFSTVQKPKAVKPLATAYCTARKKTSRDIPIPSVPRAPARSEPVGTSPTQATGG